MVSMFEMKILMHGTIFQYSYMYQFRLDISFDVSTAEKVGRWNVEGFGNIASIANGQENLKVLCLVVTA